MQTDGQLKTGRDVVIAAMLGADEMGFSTAPLIATGCIMMRACHLNTCPVGIATQDPGLRERFKGTPEHVVNFFFFVAEEVREILASLGLRSLDEAIGRVDLLQAESAIEHWKARGVDLTHILTHVELPRGRPAPARRTAAAGAGRRPGLGARQALGRRDRARRAHPVRAADPQRQPLRRRHPLEPHRPRARRGQGLPEGSIEVSFEGSAGQSFGGWLAPGVTFTLCGDANDYTGKGLSGGVLAVRPREGMAPEFRAEENVIVGNTLLYGATSGRAFFRGLAGERFAVRNSGASAVVEGVGDHGCEYMTGGRVVVLGPTGRNFAAGMSGGIAYVLDEDDDVRAALQYGHGRLRERRIEADAAELRALIEEHAQRTDSPVAARVLAQWEELLAQSAFVKVMPHDYRACCVRRDRSGAATRRRPRVIGRDGRPPPAVAGLMGKLGGFLQIERHGIPYRDPSERAHDYREFLLARPMEELREQGARCMDCGVPFCHNGCPLGNLIPDWNDLVYRDRWQDAIVQLHATNNFPELTGRLCPAPCEAACVLEIREDDAVTIKQIELAIIDRAWRGGLDNAATAAPRDRAGGRRSRLRAGGHGSRPAAAPGGASRDAVRARRGRGRPGAVRGAGLQDRKADRPAARRSADRRGRRAALRGGCRRRGRCQRAGADAASTTQSCWPRGRACRATCRCRAGSSTGCTYAMDYLYQRNRWVARELGPLPDIAAACRQSARSAPRTATWS